MSSTPLVKICKEGLVHFWEPESQEYEYGFNVGMFSTPDLLDNWLRGARLRWITREHAAEARRLLAELHGWDKE